MGLRGRMSVLGGKSDGKWVDAVVFGYPVWRMSGRSVLGLTASVEMLFDHL